MKNISMKNFAVLGGLSLALLSGSLLAGTVQAETRAAAQHAANHQANQPVNQSAIAPTQVTSVAAAKQLKDDTQVRLEGQVIRALGKEKYEFRDSTGTIIVDIDDKHWNGKPVNRTAKVVLVGEIDRELGGKVEVDIDEVHIGS
jgi:uncharacterized protein (TIGR00156 family)